MNLNKQQKIAMEYHCRLAIETVHPRFRAMKATYSIVLTVNSGYECIENGYQGPVWHSSSAMRPGFPASEKFLQRVALDALQGVGSVALGQWEEWTGTYYHVRRRLTREEQKQVGNMLDVRGTAEAIKRHAAVQCYLPAHMKNLIE